MTHLGDGAAGTPAEAKPPFNFLAGRPKFEPDDPLFLAGIQPRDLYGHGVKPYNLDLRRFRDGRATGNLHGGRPQLSSQIWGPWLDKVRALPPGNSTARQYLWAATRFWIYLDTIDAGDDNAAGQTPRIDDVREIPGIIWTGFVLWLSEHRRRTARDVLTRVGDLVVAALAALSAKGEPVLAFTAANPFPVERGRRGSAKPAYEVETLVGIMCAARIEAESVVRRIADSNAQADRGRNPVETGSVVRPQTWSREDAMAFVREAMVPDLPSCLQFKARYGFPASSVPAEPDVSTALVAHENPSGRLNGRGRNLVGALRNFLPTATDLVPFMMLALVCGSLNAETVLQLDLRSWRREDVSGSRVQGRKGRSGGAMVDAPSSNLEWGLADTLDRVVELTKPLRLIAARRLEVLRAFANGPLSDDERKQVDREIDHHAKLERRIWVALRVQPVGVHAIPFDGSFWHTATDILNKHSVRGADGETVQWSARQARRAFARSTYEESGRDLAAVALALSHSTENSSALYLDQPEVFAQEEAALRRWQATLEVEPDAEEPGTAPEPTGGTLAQQAPGVARRRPLMIFAAEARLSAARGCRDE